MNEEFSEESLRKIAEQKVLYRSSLKIHGFIYLSVNSLMMFINIMTNPRYFWFLYPLLGWFIGFGLHFTLYSMYARGTYPKFKRVVIFIFAAYSYVMLLLWVINFNTSNQVGLGIFLVDWDIFDMWAIYPTVFAGFGVLVIFLIYVLFFKVNILEDGEPKSRKERAVDKEMQKIKKSTNRNDF